MSKSAKIVIAEAVEVWTSTPHPKSVAGKILSHLAAAGYAVVEIPDRDINAERLRRSLEATARGEYTEHNLIDTEETQP